MNSFLKSEKIKFYKCDKTCDADFCIKMVIFGTSKSFHLIVIIHMHMNTDCLIRVKTMSESFFSDVKSALVQLLFLF